MRHSTRIGLLVRLISKAVAGDVDAFYALQKMSRKDAPDILALGYRGFMAVTGLGWSIPIVEERSVTQDKE
ncbi:MAG: hypothetical protein NUW37_13495 [Planctomycetes bacterium]|nr:hypothetical protein [Planctomycetota bacterium]